MAEKIFYVSIHYDANQRGYVGFNEETKEVLIKLPETDWEEKVREYLESEHTIADATGLDTYEQKQVVGINSLDEFKLALTRMWEAIEVQVDWSRPVEL